MWRQPVLPETGTWCWWCRWCAVGATDVAPKTSWTERESEHGRLPVGRRTPGKQAASLKQIPIGSGSAVTLCDRGTSSACGCNFQTRGLSCLGWVGCPLITEGGQGQTDQHVPASKGLTKSVT